MRRVAREGEWFVSVAMLIATLAFLATQIHAHWLYLAVAFVFIFTRQEPLAGNTNGPRRFSCGIELGHCRRLSAHQLAVSSCLARGLFFICLRRLPVPVTLNRLGAPGTFVHFWPD